MKMKRFITVVMLLSVFIMGGSAVYAQNTKVRTPGSTAKKKSTGSSRSSNSKKSLSVTDFLKKEQGVNGFADFKSDSQIETALRNIGFTQTSKTTKRQMIDDGTDGDTAPGKITKFVYSKNGIKVEWSSYCYDEAPKYFYKDAIVINFSDSASKNAFISNLKANGFYKESEFYYDSAYRIYVTINGNKVILMGNWE